MWIQDKKVKISVLWRKSYLIGILKPLSYILEWIIGFIIIQNSMTPTDYYLSTDISARLILNAGSRALTRTSIFFNTHNSTNPYFLTCNLFLTVMQLPQTQQEWSSTISICYRKTLPLCRFGSVSVLQDKLSRSFSLTASLAQKTRGTVKDFL